MHHTPGPWNMVGLNGDRIAIVAHDATDVATLTHATHADARIIAAAPELLTHLQRLVAAIDRAPANFADGLADEARAAINKALGE